VSHFFPPSSKSAGRGLFLRSTRGISKCEILRVSSSSEDEDVDETNIAHASELFLRGIAALLPRRDDMSERAEGQN